MKGRRRRGRHAGEHDQGQESGRPRNATASPSRAHRPLTTVKPTFAVGGALTPAAPARSELKWKVGVRSWAFATENGPRRPRCGGQWRRRGSRQQQRGSRDGDAEGVAGGGGVDVFAAVDRPHLEAVGPVGEAGIGDTRGRAGSEGARVERAFEARARLAGLVAEGRRRAVARIRRPRVDRRLRRRRVGERVVDLPAEGRRRRLLIGRQVRGADLEGVGAVGQRRVTLAGTADGEGVGFGAFGEAAFEFGSGLAGVEDEARAFCRDWGRPGGCRSPSSEAPCRLSR